MNAVAVLPDEFLESSSDRREREKICFLLEHWEDIFSPALPSGDEGASAGGGGIAFLPLMSRHPSVLELVRCLKVLKAESSLAHDHVKAYHGAPWRIERIVKRRKDGKVVMVKHPSVPRLLVPETVPRRHRRAPQWVKMGYVRRGEFRLAELFAEPVFIPDPLKEAWAAHLRGLRRG